jgi:hypothetical protein
MMKAATVAEKRPVLICHSDELPPEREGTYKHKDPICIVLPCVGGTFIVFSGLKRILGPHIISRIFVGCGRSRKAVQPSLFLDGDALSLGVEPPWAGWSNSLREINGSLSDIPFCLCYANANKERR